MKKYIYRIKKNKRRYHKCVYCGKREYDFSKLRLLEAGKFYSSESHCAHNYDCMKFEQIEQK